MNKTSKSAHILIIDDDESYRALLTRFISKSLPDIEVEERDPVKNGLPEKDHDWSETDLLIIDYRLTKDITGLDFIQANKTKPHFPAIIMLTAEGNEEIAVLAMKQGVNDYINKTKLTKEKLKQSIQETLSTYREKLKQLEKSLETTQTFNKAHFYSQLENEVLNNKQENRTLLMIAIDEYNELEQSIGYVVADKIISHLARETSRAFKGKKYNPIITRFNDESIALLINNPFGKDNLPRLIKKYFTQISKTPYTHEGETISLTLNVGVTVLEKNNSSVEGVIQKAVDASKKAEDQLGNAYCLSDEKITDKKETDKPEKRTPDKNTEDEKIVVKEKKVEEEKQPAPEYTQLNINQIIEENRIMQYYQPIMPLSDTENKGNIELFFVGVNMLNTDGTQIDDETINFNLENTKNQKILDRWMLRRATSRLVRAKEYTDINYVLFINLSDDSIADSGFFNWIKKLMEYVSKYEIGKSIILGLTINSINTKEKQVTALVNYLRQSFGIRFYIYGFSEKMKIDTKVKFDYLKISNELVNEFTGSKFESEENENGSGVVSQSKIPIIADMVENSSILTKIIGAGADFAIGNFIGAPQEQLEEMVNLEFFEIT